MRVGAGLKAKPYNTIIRRSRQPFGTRQTGVTAEYFAEAAISFKAAAKTLYLVNGGQLYTVNITPAALTPTLALGFNNVNFIFADNGLLYFTTSDGREVSVHPPR